MTRTLHVLAAAAITVLAACASSSAERGQARAECVLTSADSALLAGGPLFRECGVDTPAKAVVSRLNYNPSRAGTPVPRQGVTCYAAEVEFVVGLDGRVETETVRLVRATDPVLGQSLVESVRGWRYTPARRDGVPVRQIVNERRSIALRVASVSSGSSPARSALPPRC